MSIGYCEAWPEELKAAVRRCNRLDLLYENQRNWLTKIDPSEFDEACSKLEAIENAATSAHKVFDKLWRDYNLSELAYSKETAK